MGFTWTWPWAGNRRSLRWTCRNGTCWLPPGALAALAVLRITPQARGQLNNPVLIRPPGAGPEAHFLQHCTGCGLCLEAVPRGLQPAFLEAGLEGLWTPRLVLRIGPCEYECNRCTQVCPTQGSLR